MIKKLLKKNIAWIVLLFVLFINNKVYASNNYIEVPLVVEQFFDIAEGAEKEVDLTGKYELKTLSENPTFQENGNKDIFVFRLNGEKKNSSIPLKYAHAGVYCYELVQTTKDKANYIFDRKSYKITVYVKNVETNQLRAQVIVENEDGKKCEKIEFHNRYLIKNILGSQQNLTVKTGDKANVNIWYLVGNIAMIAIIGVSIMKKKKGNVKY
ncbi:Spy0128 family protein [Faecalimonas sp.]